MTVRFATTQWSQVVLAGESGETDARDALATLCDLSNRTGDYLLDVVSPRVWKLGVRVAWR